MASVSSHNDPTRRSTDKLIDSFICGDARKVLTTFPDECVDAIVTSPPYFRQRDYSSGDQIGNERTPRGYIEQLLIVVEQCRRVLKPSGTLWLNLGDKYHKSSLLGLPWRVAAAMQDAGWLLRSDIIWHKPNAMPSAVKNRPTTDHEYVFLFAKSTDYFYDADAVRVPHVTFTEKSRMRGGRNHFGKRNGTPEQGKNRGNPNLHDARWDQAFHAKGRNRRTVWEIPLSKFPEAHFAVFPERLVELCLLAGCPPGGVVLDPFMGSGTTALVARRLGRRFIGVDCSIAYCKMAKRRLDNGPSGN
ncbi:MAG: site-specific DNA-methyltransferase [Pirellulales bacterium]|nr:site-specific DNA-methyltransferase [Pirellulales bacterium]